MLSKASLQLFRDRYTQHSTSGKLFLNNKFLEIYTLEDYCRDINRDGDLDDVGETKIYGETAIPSGTYKLSWYNSPRFKKELLLFHNVKNYDGVLIHAGNTKIDTHGCILVGLTRDIDTIGSSVKALTKLHALIKPFTEIQIQIIDIPKSINNNIKV